MKREEAFEFVQKWLPAWTGNDPDKLLSFYDANAYYQDPAQPEGLKGKNEIRAYFEQLLAKNPEWKWHAEKIIPTEKGFILKWRAEIPVGQDVLEEKGVDIIEMEEGKIAANEVYFDRSKLLEKWRQEKES